MKTHQKNIYKNTCGKCVSPDYLRLIIERENDAIIIRVGNKLKFVNKKAVELFGFPEDKLLKRSFGDFIAPETKKNFKQAYSKLIEGGETQHETKIVNSKGEHTLTEFNCSLIKYDGKPAVLSIIRDIRERKKKEEERFKEETKYRVLTENSQDLIFVIDRQLNVEYVNKLAAKYFKSSPKELIGKSIARFFKNDGGKIRVSNLRKIFKTGKPGYFENKMHLPIGDVWLSTWLVPIKNEEGGIVGLMGGSRDISERKQAEERIQKHAGELEKFKLAVENASDQVVITDINGNIIYANQALESITGYSVSESLGKNPAKLWGGRMPKEYYEKMWKEIKIDKKSFINEINNQRKNGDKYIAEIKISPVLNEKNEILFFVGTERDITKIKEIDRAKSEFISLASHQLRTPLSIVRWYVEVLLRNREGNFTPKDLNYLNEIYQGNLRMIDLVNSLLNVSRIESGAVFLFSKLTDVVETTTSIINDLISSIEKKKIKLKRVYPKTLKTYIDPQLVQITTQNFISNAIKYSKEGGNVSVELKKEKDSLFIKVSDDGYGIPKLQQSKIFTKLFRADNAKEIDLNGNGIGLYIVKSLVDKAKGKIWFKSEENKGTVFYAELPVKKQSENIPINSENKGLIL